jgi:thioredoxin reductase (NADPH)
MMDTRRDQLFPTLDATDRGRICRFGVRRRYRAGEQLVSAGETSPGMFVLLAGELSVTQRDGLGRVVPIVRYGPGQFLAEVGQLSGRPSLVDGHAATDVEVLLVDPATCARC